MQPLDETSGFERETGRNTTPALRQLLWLNAGGSNPASQFLVCAPLEESIEQLEVVRDLHCVEFLGHTDAVVAIVVPERMWSTASSVGKAPTADDAEALGEKLDAKEENNARSRTIVAPEVRAEEDVIFSAALDNTVRCWDDHDVSERFRMAESKSEIASMMLLPGVNMLVTGHEDGTVRWWNPDSGSLVSARGHTNTVSCVAHAATAKEAFVLSASYDSSVAVWSATPRRDGRFTPHLEGQIFDAHHASGAFGTAGARGGNGSDDGTAVRVKVDRGEILCMIYHPESECIVSGGNDSLLRCWGLHSLSCAATLRGHEDAVTCVEIDAQFLFSGSDDNTIRIWSLTSVSAAAEQLGEPQGLGSDVDSFAAASAQPIGVIRAHTQTVRDLLLVPGPGYLVSCGADSKINVWDYTAAPADGDDSCGRLLKEVSCHDEEPRCLAYKMISGPADDATSGTFAVLAGMERGRILKVTLTLQRHDEPEDEPEDEEAPQSEDAEAKPESKDVQAKDADEKGGA